MPPIIQLKNVLKEFKVPEKKTGIIGTFMRKNTNFVALDNVSFSVEEGEILGYIGPNGGGKSTTIKILTGILVPTSGEVRVLDFIPWKQRYQYTYNIGVVFGQKSLLNWDVAPVESFKLYKEIYEMNEEDFQSRLKYLVNVFAIEEFMHIPTRKLSLGQRMRCEIVAALIHKPKILFLDEPTIGLDVLAKQKMRDAIREINQNEKTTVILTTHDMNDIEALASRVIVLDKGKIIYQGNLDDLKKEFAQDYKLIFEPSAIKNKSKFDLFLSKYPAERDGKIYSLNFSSKQINPKKLLDELFDSADLEKFEIFAPTLEEVVREIYGHRSP